DLHDPVAVDVAEALHRTEGGVVEVGAGDGGRAVQLGPPAQLLDARQRDEVAGGGRRPPARRGSVRVVGEPVAVAEGPACEDAGYAAVEAGEEGTDVARRSQRL